MMFLLYAYQITASAREGLSFFFCVALIVSGIGGAWVSADYGLRRAVPLLMVFLVLSAFLAALIFLPVQIMPEVSH